MNPSSPSDQDDDATIPHSKSPGNQGARGSRGQANSGALEGDSSNAQGNERASTEGSPDLRDADAQGGGGAGSQSSRSS